MRAWRVLEERQKLLWSNVFVRLLGVFDGGVTGHVNFPRLREDSVKKILVAAMLIVGLAFVGCDGDSDGGKSGPGSGNTGISLELSGGHLSAPLVFEGTIERSPNLFGTSTSILAMGVDLQASNGDAVLTQFTVDISTGESGPYDAEGGDLDLVFWFPDIEESYSLRPRGGSGGIVLDRGDDDRATLQIHFDASPTQVSATDVVFRLEGVIDSRK